MRGPLPLATPQKQSFDGSGAYSQGHIRCIIRIIELAGAYSSQLCIIQNWANSRDINVTGEPPTTFLDLRLAGAVARCWAEPCDHSLVIIRARVTVSALIRHNSELPNCLSIPDAVGFC